MDAPTPPRPTHAPQPLITAATPERLQALLDELTVLNIKLEYLKLMLKLGVRRV